MATKAEKAAAKAELKRLKEQKATGSVAEANAVVAQRIEKAVEVTEEMIEKEQADSQFGSISKLGTIDQLGKV